MAKQGIALDRAGITVSETSRFLASARQVNGVVRPAEALRMAEVPTHLKGWAIPAHTRLSWAELTAALACPCGGTAHEFHHPGPTFRDSLTGTVHPGGIDIPGPGGEVRAHFAIRAVCTRCRNGVVVFDPDLHGWDAVTATPRLPGRNHESPRPALVPWSCPECGAFAHTGVVGSCSTTRTISSPAPPARCLQPGGSMPFTPSAWS
jgi:hypothetical protein